MHAVLVVVLAAAQAVAADSTVRPGLAYAKAFGGSGTDITMAVATDAAGNAYVAGYTNSADFPVRNGLQMRIGGTPLRVSGDGGKSWTAPQIAPGVNAIAGSAQQPAVLYAGTGSGIYKSVDSGGSWSLLPSAPLVETGAIVVDAIDPQVILAATVRGIFRSTDAGATWNAELPAPGNAVFYMPNLFVHPARPATVFASLYYSLYRSTDGGTTWTRLDGMPVESISLAFDGANPDILYAAAWDIGIYRSLDGGDSWKKLADLPVTFSRHAIAVGGASIYLATSNGVMRSTDGGLRWTATAITAAADVVAVDPANPQVVYAAADQVYRSADGGASWSPLLAAAAHSVATIGAGASALFVGSVQPQNIFITKWSADGKEMLYSTYLGGSYYDYATAITVDRDGNLYVTGLTYSADFPVTAGAVQARLKGPYNAFVAKISADGSRLLYSTLLGGSAGDAANAITIDSVGHAYLTGYTASADFPVTPAVWQPALSQGCTTATTEGDAFVAGLSPDGGSLLFATYLGGSCADLGLGIALDGGGNIYVAGVTGSLDFPVTRGALTSTYQDGWNHGFLAKLTPRGDSLAYATFLGTGWGDVAQAVTVDNQGNAYVTGSTLGLDSPGPSFGSASYTIAGFPGSIATSGPAYVLKLDPAGKKIYATNLGQCMDTDVSVAVDSAGRVWVAGSTGIPPKATAWFEHNCIGPNVSTVHPFEGLNLGWGFVSELSADGATVLFSSLVDQAASLALDADGNAVVGGQQNLAGVLQTGHVLLLKISGSVASPLTIEEPKSKAATPHSYELLYPAVVAPGAMVVIPGTGLGPDLEARGDTTPGGTLAATLAGTRVTFDGIPAPLISVQDQQVVCMAPFALAGRTVTTVRVERGGSVSNAIRVPVTPTAVAVVAVVNQDGTANSKDHPAAPGSVIAIYVSGLGPSDPPTPDGLINSLGSPPAKAGVEVLLNDWLAGDILYSGAAPSQPAGITQINFRIPASIPGIGPWPAGQYWLVAGTGNDYSGDHDWWPLMIR